MHLSAETFRSSPEFEILRALALQVRVLTVEQVARGWFSHTVEAERQAIDCLDRLEHATLIERRIVEAHPLIPLTEPLFTWHPGATLPSDDNFHAISEASKRRWTRAHIAIEVFLATRRASRLFGSFVDARNLKHCEASHDLHLAEVYLNYRGGDLQGAANWWGEAAFPKMGLQVRFAKDPDAFVLDAKGTACRIVEFAGSYETEHIRKFHEHCAGGAAARLGRHFSAASNGLSELYAANGTAYELW